MFQYDVVSAPYTLLFDFDILARVFFNMLKLGWK